jgi:flagellar protein FliL
VADDAVAEDFDEDFDEIGGKKKFSGKKLILFVVLPVLLLGGGGIAFMMMGGDKDKAEDHAKAAAPARTAPAELPKTVFFDLPEMLVNLNSNTRRPTFLKIHVSLELTSDQDAEYVEKMSPRIIDNFQVYLRELRIDDLRGSAGIYRLREELLARINMAVRPAKVKDVLFKEVLVQ